MIWVSRISNHGSLGQGLIFSQRNMTSSLFLEIPQFLPADKCRLVHEALKVWDQISNLWKCGTHDKLGPENKLGLRNSFSHALNPKFAPLQLFVVILVTT